MRKLITAAIAAALLALPGTALANQGKGAGGVTPPGFYVDGGLYRTVGTPALLGDTGAPDHSFDVIYNVSDYQSYNVATAAPGDPGFNGGRWMVHKLTFTDYDAALAAVDDGSGDFDSDEEIEAARSMGYISADKIVASFECPVIPLPHGH